MTRRSAPGLLAVLLATACSSTGDAGPTTGPRPTAASSTSAPTSAAAAGVEVLEVVDGDTLRVVLDGGEEEVRLRGINAPEHDECFGDRAREALEQRLAGGPLRLGEGTERDQYGRLLAYAYAGDTLLNLALVQNGLALALHTEHPRLAEFLQADEQAYSSGIGMWAVDACGPPSMAPVTIIDLSFDPPGRDEDDLNGEWVLLADRSDQEADLSGWVLRDESSDHRYHFPAGTVLQPGGQVRVHTGSGEDGGSDLFWGEDGPVWNNGGDTALLLDPAGNVAGRLRYSAA